MDMLGKLLFLLLLAGCSTTKTDISKITTPAIKNAEEAIDYAKNNIEQTDDTRFMLSQLEACHASLISCETIGNNLVDSKEKEIKNRELMIGIAAVLAFVLGRILRV